MPISGSDFKWWRSSNGDSEGGTKSATEIVDATSNNIWPTYNDAERIAGVTAEYRKSFVSNEHGSLPAVLPCVWIADTPDSMTESLGLGHNSSDDDDPAAGNLTAWTAGAVVSVQSSAADTRAFTVVGMVGSTPTEESGTLNGTTPVLTTAVFTEVFHVRLASVSGSLTVTIKQGSGGTTRGTIGTGMLLSFLWLAATTKATGLRLVDLAAGTNRGLWHRQSSAPAAAAVPNNLSVIAIEEA